MTLTVTPTTQLASSTVYLRSMLADTTAFQTLVGAVDADDAKNSIWIGRSPDVQDASNLPRAILRRRPAPEIFPNIAGANGQIVLYLDLEIPEAYRAVEKTGDAIVDYENKTGLIMEQLETGSFPSGQRVSIIQTMADEIGKIAEKEVNGLHVMGGTFLVYYAL